MFSNRPLRRGVIWRGAAGTALAATMLSVSSPAARAESTAKYVVTDTSSNDASAAAADTGAVGGSVTLRLDSAQAVVASLTQGQLQRLQALPAVTTTPDVVVPMSASASGSGRAPAAVFPQQTGATQLWSQGTSGAGVAVAIVDTGIAPLPDFAGRLLPGVDLTGGGNAYQDDYGHGTFVAGLIAGNGASSNGIYKGEAPSANLVSVKVAGGSGQTDLATVIQGIDWVTAHHASEHIGVLNLSLGYIPGQSSLADPLDQAVERAWQAGVVVVTSAGNDGPSNGTVLSPGDDPLVITVGAVDDHGTVSPAGDTQGDFSSAGPTDPDGWYKPDLVASGVSVVSLMAPGSTVANANPGAVVGSANFVGSGTSFSAAITSGAAALLLSARTNLHPDQVKADLLGTASPGPVGDPFVDGHGLLNVAAAAGAHLQLQQGDGVLSTNSGYPGDLVIRPGDTVSAGATVQTPDHSSATTQLIGGVLAIPVACAQGGPVAGDVQVPVPTTAYSSHAVQAPTSYSQLPASAPAPDLCSGQAMYPAGNGANVTFTGSLMSTDTVDAEAVKTYFAVGAGHVAPAGGGSAVPVGEAQEGSTVDLGSTYTESTWNPALWHGLSAKNDAAPDSTSGSSWDGTTWNGAAWNGHAWNGHAWNGHAWNGHAWNGHAWNGHAWNGASWGPSAASSSSVPANVYLGYSLVSTSPDQWCPTGVQIGNAGAAGHPGGGSNPGGPGSGGQPGCGSNGGNGGDGGNGSSVANGGAGGNGGNGGCPAATDAQMAAGQFPCDGTHANGGQGGSGGNANGTMAGGPGGAGGNGGQAPNAGGGNGGSGANATSAVAGGTGGNGGRGGGCDLYTASYWVSCPANGGRGGKGGNANVAYDGGNGGSGGNGGASSGANGDSGTDGSSASSSGPGQAGADGASA